MSVILYHMHVGRKPADPVLEYSRVGKGVLLGTNARCREHFEKMLLGHGVTADISLEGERVDHPYGIDVYLWLPTTDHQAPDRVKVEVGIGALKHLLALGRTVYIHCKNVHGRAPTFYAAYLIATEGLSPEAAVARIKAARAGIHLEDVQWAFLREFAAAL